MTKAEQIMMNARLALVLDQPFWGALAMHLHVQEDPGCGTAWTDGHSFGYDPKFIESLKHEQAVALWAHEVSHVALGHPWRREDRSHKDWNIACDKTINSDLLQAGFVLPPDPHVAEGDEVGKSAEWIYARMQNKPKPPQGGKQPQQQQGQGQGPQQGQGQGQGQGDQSGDGTPQPDPLGEVRDAPKNGMDQNGEPVASEQDWKNRVVAAMQQAKLMGSMPGGAEISATKALKPRVDVKALLLRFMQERCAADYTWAKPNPRYTHLGMYLPALESKELGEVAIMVDTSGSMMDATSLAYAQGIVQDVLDECNPAGTSLVFADARVQHVQRLEKGDPLVWTPKGGGGTNFIPALKHIDEDGQYVCTICITDLYGKFPDVEPDIPVIWLTTTENKQAPFGETIFVDR